MTELVMRRRPQPREDLALTLPATRTRSPHARLLEGILHLVSRRARMPARDLRTQLRALFTTRDLHDQRARHLPARQLCTRRRHHPYRGRPRKLGPPRVTKSRDPANRSLGGLPTCAPDSRPIEPTASHSGASGLGATAAARMPHGLAQDVGHEDHLERNRSRTQPPPGPTSVVAASVCR